MDTSLPDEPRKLNLAELAEKEERALGSAFIFVWVPDPARERVRVILDDGMIKMSLHRDKFLQLLANVIDIDKSPTNYHFFKIKESCHRYGGWYLYDKEVDEFIELGEKPGIERLRPIDLLTEARREMVVEKIVSYRGIREATKDNWKHKAHQPQTLIEKRGLFHRVFRELKPRKKGTREV